MSGCHSDASIACQMPRTGFRRRSTGRLFLTILILLTAIFGREAAYSGKELTWEKALDMRRQVDTANLKWDSDMPVPPVPVPGKYKLV